MRRLVLASVAVVGVSYNVYAADVLPVYSKEPSLPPQCTWCGFYQGVNLGYGSSRDTLDVVGTPGLVNPPFIAAPPLQAAAIIGVTQDLPLHSKGFIGGGQIGFMRQFDRFVVGLEADLEGTSARGSATTSNFVVVNGFPGTSTSMSVSNRLKWLHTLRGEVGYAVLPSLLLYGTGGVAFGGVESNTSINQGLPAGIVGGPSDTSFSGTQIGWSAGVGAAWMFARNWSTKVEYLHYDLGSVSYGSSSTTFVGAPGGTFFYSINTTSTAHFSGDIVRVGLDYHFN